MGIYVNITGIAGNATSSNHNNWIQLSGLSFASARTTHTLSPNSQANEISKPSISDITLTKVLDSASPLLFSDSCKGLTQDTMVIHICKTDEALSPVAIITLFQVITNSYHLNISEAEHLSGSPCIDIPSETITCHFKKIEYRFIPYDNHNQPGSPITAEYDGG